jgi:hypothetical protein
VVKKAFNKWDCQLEEIIKCSEKWGCGKTIFDHAVKSSDWLTNKILIGTCYFLFSRQWTPVTYQAAPGLRKIYAGLSKYWEIKVWNLELSFMYCL